MKVMQINVCSGLSTGRIAANLSTALIKQGHDCLFAFSRGSAPAGIPSVRIGGSADMYFHAVMSRITDRSGFFSRAATKRLIDQIRTYSPDIIHLHNIHGYYLHVGLLFKFLRDYGRPVVWTLHDSWSFTGHCSYFNDCGCEKWKEGCHDCEQKNAYPVRWLFDQSKKNYKDKKELFTAVPNMTLVTPSKWLAGIVKQSFMGVHDIKVVNNGVDQKIFGPTKGDFRKRYDIVDKRMILGVASPWSRRKGLDDFVTLSGMLDDSYRIVLVGLSDKQLSALPGNINGISRTENVHQLAEIYTTADVFVNPTYEDNFPTVNIEAISCGTPVITYDTGGSGEVADETCGCIVPCGDVDALAQAARTFTAPADACLERAKRYSIAAFCEQYLDIYNSLIG